MNKPSLILGILVAACMAAVSLGGAAVASALFGWHRGFPVLLAGLAWLYMIFLLSCAKEKIGRLAIGCVGTFGLGGLVVLGFSWPVVLMAGVALLWVTRSLYAYGTLTGALMDAVLCGLSVGWALAAYGATGSLAWGAWCFFLAQALAGLIPDRPSLEPAGARGGPEAEADRFARAHRAAEAAIRVMAGGS